MNGYLWGRVRGPDDVADRVRFDLVDSALQVYQLVVVSLRGRFVGVVLN